MRAFLFLMTASVLVLGACTAGRVGLMDGEAPGMDGSLADGEVRDGSARDGDVSDTGSGRDGSPDFDGGMFFDAGRDSSVITPLFEIDCDDMIDQDLDGDTDCEDSDCNFAPCNPLGDLCMGGTCGGCRMEASETMCGDAADEDCDGQRDCADSECDGMPCSTGGVTCSAGVCPGCESGFNEQICGDATDDDCDGMTDCADPDCLGRACDVAGFVCIGGSCMCPGGMELCNGVDDNCTGVPDEGCPDGITTCCASSGGSFGSSTGSVWTDPCPAGSALIGIAGNETPQLDQLIPICGTISFEVDMMTMPEYTYTMEVGPPVRLSAHGAAGPTDFEDVCPPDQIAIGVRGHAREPGGFVDQIGLSCARVSVLRGGGFNWIIEVSFASMTALRGSIGLGEPFNSICPTNAIVTTMNGREGTRLNRVGFGCERLVLGTM